MLKRLLEKYKRWSMINETVNELSSLSDRELMDIGIHRGMIRSVAHGFYNG